MRTKWVLYTTAHHCHRGKILERAKFDVDKFGSPTSYQIFPSILRMRCVKGQHPSRGHQEITAAIHCEATARDLIPKFSFISKDQFQNFPTLILALPKKKPSNCSPGGTHERKQHDNNLITTSKWFRCFSSLRRWEGGSSGPGLTRRLRGQPGSSYTLLHTTTHSSVLHTTACYCTPHTTTHCTPRHTLPHTTTAHATHDTPTRYHTPRHAAPHDTEHTTTHSASLGIGATSTRNVATVHLNDSCARDPSPLFHSP